MNAFRQNKAACAYPAMLLNGVCASSGGVVMALLQERYGLSYQWSGLLLATVSYTHLDVYKRQPFSRCGAAPCGSVMSFSIS